MYEKQFAQRLAELRTQKGFSARDMSISIGQNPGYINRIENGKSFPTMANFFYICEYLHVTPKEFFDFDTQPASRTSHLNRQVRRLSDAQLNALTALVDSIVDKP